MRWTGWGGAGESGVGGGLARRGDEMRWRLWFRGQLVGEGGRECSGSDDGRVVECLEEERKTRRRRGRGGGAPPAR